MTLFFIIGAGITALGFVLFYKLYWEPRIHKNETIAILRSKGIGERPETIVKKYYKIKGNNKSEREIRNITKQFMRFDQDFFLTMWEVIRKDDSNC